MSSSDQHTPPLAGLMAAMGDPAAWASILGGALPGFGAAAGSTATTEQADASDPLPYRVDPARLMELQNRYRSKLADLWGGILEARPRDPPDDRRFGSPAWTGVYAYVAEFYLLNASFLEELAEIVEADPKVKSRIRFAVEQWIDAMSPANFLVTNPEASKKLIETRGDSLSAGLANMLSDMAKGRISQSDETAFEVGRNLATTEGAVVYRNELFELIQYKPRTETVYERPLLIVPPCINKFYILDLQPDNSFVRHAVERGHTVFIVSWRNPEAGQAHFTWDAYIEDATIRAIHLVQAISGHDKINILGFCVGGTIVATALAVLAARGEEPAASLTLLTTLLDFTNTGILDVFIDEAHVQMREHTVGGIDGAACGLLPARDLATSFSFLRPNDLVWNYVVSNYLKGETPPPFDILYWNADGTNLPGPFYVWYLRNAYLENNLARPGKAMVCGAPVDLGRIKAPVYIYASREDHIVPWDGAYASTRLLKGPKRFVLGASGHIAGVINPPAKKKRNYWVYQPLRGRFPANVDAWYRSAASIDGSWWPDWADWLTGHAGGKVEANARLGNAQYRPIEAAPGAYVKVRVL